MSKDTIKKGNTALEMPAELSEDDEYYWEDWDLYHSEKFARDMQEVFAEIEDMELHPEKYKVYDSVKEMFRDMGFDVSNMPDD